MSKYSQLVKIQELGLPTPKLKSLKWSDFKAGVLPVEDLRFPLAVRSTYSEEDGETKSYAGNFETRLQVEEKDLSAAVQAVFASYPSPDQQIVLLQEMIQPDYSGVLFAFRKGIWKIEMAEGLGENVVGGKMDTELLFLPKFSKWDQAWAHLLLPWKVGPFLNKKSKKSLLQLSVQTQTLLQAFPEAKHGLDIEFSIVQGKLYFLQARPITTPNEAEQVLTSANHKEILPPQPSPLMTDVISTAGPALFDFYKKLDPSLPDYAFLVEAEGMPWINLSALLDTMVHWGLPTGLVANSVGAVDFYQVGLRPWRMLKKLPVFFKLGRQQRGVPRKVKDWVNAKRNLLRINRMERELLWQSDPMVALDAWVNDFSQFYIELVTQMQLLTGAMSGPVALLNKLGLMDKMATHLSQRSASTDYFQAFQDLKKGLITKESFLRQFGHRGFYESDIGQVRFWEYSEGDWMTLLQAGQRDFTTENSSHKKRKTTPFYLKPVVQLIHTREWIRHMSMRFFWLLREELMGQTQQKMGADFQPWDYRPDDLKRLLEGELLLSQIPAYPTPSGWDMDTFLCNQHGRRIPLEESDQVQKNGIGIYPGIVKGQVWRVSSASIDQIEIPPYEQIILVADALDPGWIPFFTEVDGVASYIGGLLSHASIILREAGIPAVTQLPKHLDLQEGEWIEIDGKTGVLRRLEEVGNQKVTN
ncbi:MAG: phosphoenolpyruvate synthase [Saprospiraceae bacterium]